MEQFVHQQKIAIFRRLLSAQNDNDGERRQKLLKLLAAEEEAAKKNSLALRQDVLPGSAFSNPR